MSVHFASDPTTLQANLGYAASLSDSQLDSYSVVQLRELIRVCGIRQVIRNGKPEPIRRARREELLEALSVATSPYKLLASANLEPALVEENIRKLDFESVCNLLKLAEQQPTDSERQAEARAIAYEVNDWIARTYTDTPELARHFTRCNHRGQYRSRVSDLVQKEDSLLLTGVFGVFADTLSALGKYDADAKAKANSDRLTSYSTNTRSIRVETLHEWVNKVLASPNTSDWKNLAIAVAASTGRRVYSEVLSGTGKFEVANEYMLTFTGVAKGKELNTDSYLIPTIAPASQVVTAIERLGDKRSTCDNPANFEEVLECRRKAEKRHSKNLGDYWNKHLCTPLLGLESTDVEAKKEELTRLHGLRKLYVMHFTRGLSDRDLRKKASQLLCHSGDGSVASDAYTSEFTLVD